MKKTTIIGAIAAAMLLGAQSVQAQSTVGGETAKDLQKKAKILKANDKAKANLTKAEKKLEASRKASEKAAKRYEDAQKDLEKARKKAEDAQKEVNAIEQGGSGM